MRFLFLIVISGCVLGGCTPEAYHEYKLTNSLTHGQQIPHWEALQRLKQEREQKKRAPSYCGKYGEAYGGFTVSCT